MLKVIVANPTMIHAYKAGVPGNGQPFPDGSMIVKLQWKPKKSTEAESAVEVPDVFSEASSWRRTARDFRKPADGDTRCSITTRQRTNSRPIPARETAKHVPYGREGEGLHVPPVREALSLAAIRARKAKKRA